MKKKMNPAKLFNKKAPKRQPFTRKIRLKVKLSMLPDYSELIPQNNTGVNNT